MPNMKQVCLALVPVCALFSTAAAQESSSSTQRSTLTITANATVERVRITAPSSIVQMHVEVYAASGEKLFDQEIRGGNVFDWHLQDGQAQRLAPGAYVCVVTAKSVSGRLAQKLGTVTVAEKSASVQAGSLQLSLQQTQAIGPVEADSSWTIAGENEPQTPTVIANDGTDGQMIRGRGALTFRIGNFFSGLDTEQMRLTEAGDLGIGTSQPQAKLDVAGTIRAQRFLVVKPNLGNGDKTAAATQATDAVDGVQPLVAGTGTQNQIAKWTDNAGTLGDSGITETGGNVGIGTTNPGQLLQVNSAAGTNSAIAFSISGTVYGQWGIAGSNNSLIAGSVLGDSVFRNNGGQNILFSTNSGGSAQLYLRNGGNVGIGTNVPGARLDVAGDINAGNHYNIAGQRVLSLDGTENTFAGVNAGQSNTTGTKNSFFGFGSGKLNQNGSNNSFFGHSAGANGLLPAYSSIFGYEAGFNNDGFSNSIFGALAGRTNKYGGNNSFFGFQAGYNTVGSFPGPPPLGPVSGWNNTFIGYEAGDTNTLGGKNTIVGADADVGSNDLDYATAIGADAVVNTSDTIALGRTDGTDTVLVYGKLQIDTLAASGSTELCLNGNNRVGPCSASSLRYKKAVLPFAAGLSIINQLQPIAFTWKHDGLRDLGLAAEDVALVEPMLTFKNKEGEIEGVKYNRVNLVLINAVKEQQQQIAALRTRLRRLEQALQRPEAKRRHR